MINSGNPDLRAFPVISDKYRSNIKETVNALCEVSILEKIIIQHLTIGLPSWSDAMN